MGKRLLNYYLMVLAALGTLLIHPKKVNCQDDNIDYEDQLIAEESATVKPKAASGAGKGNCTCVGAGGLEGGGSSAILPGTGNKGGCGGKCGGSCGGICKVKCSSAEDRITAHCNGKSCMCCRKKDRVVPACSGRCGGTCGGSCKPVCSSTEDKITADCGVGGCSCCRPKDACPGRCGYLNRYYCRNYCPISLKISGTCSGSHCTCCRT